MKQQMMEIHGVTKRFGGRPVVDRLSFQVGRGEVVGLIGPNGSGKTTTIRLLNGVIQPNEGEISVFGYDPVHDGDAIRSISGILTESAGFYHNLSGLENLRFFADLYGVTDRGRPLILLEEFGLEPHRNQKVGTYSTGMKKRLGLAKALLHQPDILFLDEPTNGLDPEGIRMVLDYIAALNQRDGTTIILCSHLLQQLEVVCHRYLFLNDGRLIEQGTLSELEERYTTQILLEVETDLALQGESYGAFAARQVRPGRIQFTLTGRPQVPDLLRTLLREANVYGATIANQSLESLYFRIREVTAHE